MPWASEAAGGDEAGLRAKLLFDARIQRGVLLQRNGGMKWLARQARRGFQGVTGSFAA